jgi:hypothetical protein
MNDFYILVSHPGGTASIWWHSADHPLSVKGFTKLQEMVTRAVSMQHGGILIPAEAVGIQALIPVPADIAAERHPEVKS